MEEMAGVEDIGWDSLPMDPDGLGAIGEWHDKCVPLRVILLNPKP